MKKILFSLLAVLFVQLAYSQDAAKMDTITLNDGRQLVGEVTKQDDAVVSFIPSGEEAAKMISLSDVTRIDYADGKTWEIGFGELEEGTIDWNAKMEKYRNKIAVLPFVYEDNYNENVPQTKSLEVQLDCIKDIERVNTNVEVIPLDSVNARLDRENVNWRNIGKYIPAEVADIVGAEYIVYGKVIVTPLGEKKEPKDSFGTENQTIDNPQGRREGASINTKNFETIVSLNIYNILGETVYSDAHESFWQTPDAYHINLDYLINQSPLNMHMIKSKN